MVPNANLRTASKQVLPLQQRGIHPPLQPLFPKNRAEVAM